MSVLINRKKAKSIMQKLVSAKLGIDEVLRQKEMDDTISDAIFDMLDVTSRIADFLIDPGISIDQGAVTWFLFEDSCGTEGLLTPPGVDVNPDSIDSVDDLLDAIGY